MKKNNFFYRSKHRSFTYFIPAGAVILIFIFGFNLILLFSNYHILKPLSRLEKPHEPLTYLLAPLVLPSYLSSVLGAQSIDPADIVRYVNIERGKIGSKSLRINTTLLKAAQMRADVILKYQNFSHQDPFENIELVTVLPKLQYRYKYASENIGMGGLSAETFVNGFMSSESHRRNLLNPDLTDTGTAVVTGPYKQYYVNIAVQIFAIPGGLDEYLGYSYEDTKKYKQSLDEVNSKLNPFLWSVNTIMGNKEYSKEKYQKLVKQKEILNKIYTVMKEDKPLQNEQVALILEYNNNLN